MAVIYLQGTARGVSKVEARGVKSRPVFISLINKIRRFLDNGWKHV